MDSVFEMSLLNVRSSVNAGTAHSSDCNIYVHHMAIQMTAAECFLLAPEVSLPSSIEAKSQEGIFLPITCLL